MSLPEQVSGVSPLAPSRALSGAAARRQARRSPAVRPRSGKVTAEHVAPWVWKTALKIAEGNTSRIRIIDVGRVEIH